MYSDTHYNNSRVYNYIVCPKSKLLKINKINFHRKSSSKKVKLKNNIDIGYSQKLKFVILFTFLMFFLLGQYGSSGINWSLIGRLPQEIIIFIPEADPATPHLTNHLSHDHKNISQKFLKLSFSHSNCQSQK